MSIIFLSFFPSFQFVLKFLLGEIDMIIAFISYIFIYLFVCFHIPCYDFVSGNRKACTDDIYYSIRIQNALRLIDQKMSVDEVAVIHLQGYFHSLVTDALKLRRDGNP